MKVILLLCALLYCCSHAAQREASLAGARPNIILILTDDQGYADLSCHGNPVLKTPNIDRLHSEGVRFDNFHVSPTCAPTRSALMTGRHEFKNGVTHTIHERERMTLKATTIAQVLQRAGYRTGIFGKWHLGDEDPYQPDRRGFDEVFIHGGGGIGQTYQGSCGDAPGNTYFDPAILHNSRFEKTEGYCTDVFFGQARRWIKSGRKPFFAYITPNAPHSPLQVRPEDEQRYAGKVPDNTAKFFGMIANIDDNVGDLLQDLQRANLDTNTLVIFMNDNGGTGGVRVYNAGMRGAKGTPWVGGTRASSFWRWPGHLSPATVQALTAHIDVFPTLCDLAGARFSASLLQQVEGRSLLPLLRNPSAAWPNRVLVTHVGRWESGAAADSKLRNCSIRDTRWQMVSVPRNGSRSWQLFDLHSDPGQESDVAGEHSEVVTRLSKQYDTWWASVQPFLVNENTIGPRENPFKVKYWRQIERLQR